MAVRVDLNISLDGFATTTDQTPEDPFGPDWARLVEAYVATRTFRARVLHETPAKGRPVSMTSTPRPTSPRSARRSWAPACSGCTRLE